MKQENKEFHQSILSFIKTNKTIFDEIKSSYTEVKTILNNLLEKNSSQITIADLEDLDEDTEQNLVIELGSYLASIKKVVKKKFVIEYVIKELGFDITLCRISLQAFDFFHIKDQLKGLPEFKNLVISYKADKLDMDQLWRLKDMIGYWLNYFNNNHLRSFSKNLFEMTYKELKAIKEGCEEQTRGTYKIIKISKDGTTESVKPLCK